MAKEYLCELHGRRILVEPPECSRCEPRQPTSFLRKALQSVRLETQVAEIAREIAKRGQRSE